MTAKTIAVNFEGYWREPNIGGLPASSGVYCVYTCTFNADTNKVSIDQLIYIGEGRDVKDRVDGHECWPKWKEELGRGQVLCLSAAAVPSDNRTRTEAALIFEHKPTCNTEYTNTFPFDDTTISATGKVARLTTSFTVRKTD
jgi:hypothetical protein